MNLSTLFRTIAVAISLLLPFLPVHTAHGAAFTTLDFTSQMNLNLQTKNALYPSGEFLTRFAVPFAIPTTGNNTWGAGNGITGAVGNDGLWSLEVPVNLAHVSSIYTLAGTDWGFDVAQRLSITAFFDSGQQVVWNLIDGQHLRDWNLFPVFSTTIDHTSTNEVFRVSPPLPVYDGNPDVLDMQTLKVPDFLQSATLSKLRFVDDRISFGHSAFISGITVSNLGPVTPGAIEGTVQAVPEPSTLMLVVFGTGIAAVGMTMRTQQARP